MKRILMAVILTIFMAPAAYAVSTAEDIAVTIMLKGYECGGKYVIDISEEQDAQGGTITRATCPNGVRYQITVTSDGRMQVQPLD